MNNKKTNNKKPRQAATGRKKLVWVFLVFFASVAAVIICFALQKQLIQKPAEQKSPSSNISINHPDENKKTTENSDQNSEETSKKEELRREEGNKKPVQYETSKPEPKEIVGYVNSKQIVKDHLIINATIRQLLPEGSTCALTISSAQFGSLDTIVTTTGSDPSNSYCKSFKIPKEKLASGKWKIEIDVKSGTKTGTITDEVEL